MSRLIWAPLSRLDLASIDAFLAERDGIAAACILREIKATASRLPEFPRLGRVLEEPIRVIGVRGTPYLIVYRLSGLDIEIARVRHRRENWFAFPVGS